MVVICVINSTIYTTTPQPIIYNYLGDSASYGGTPIDSGKFAGVEEYDPFVFILSRYDANGIDRYSDIISIAAGSIIDFDDGLGHTSSIQVSSTADEAPNYMSMRGDGYGSQGPFPAFSGPVTMIITPP